MDSLLAKILAKVSPDAVVIITVVLSTVLAIVSTMKISKESINHEGGAFKHGIDMHFFITYTIRTILIVGILVGLFWRARGFDSVPWSVVAVMAIACFGVYVSILVDASMRHVDTESFRETEQVGRSYVRRMLLHSLTGASFVLIFHFVEH